MLHNFTLKQSNGEESMRGLIFTLILLFLFSCSKPEQEYKVTQTQDNEQVTVSNFTAPDKPEFFYRELHKIQQKIMRNPASREFKEAFIYNAYIEDNNALISLGSARTKNPESGELITSSLVRRAALLDAKRWAVYGLLWLNNDFQPDFGKISETHQGVFQELYSFNSGDSLIIAIATPVR
jgi:hypothetical protein